MTLAKYFLLLRCAGLVLAISPRISNRNSQRVAMSETAESMGWPGVGGLGLGLGLCVWN